MSHSVILPGSYDPITLGHLDIIKKASEIYDEVYVVAFINPEKEYMFSVDERLRMLMIATDELDNVLVSFSNGLVIDYMREHEIDKIVKGYRNDTDLEYEMRQAEWNLQHGGVETELIKASPELADISSTRVRKALKENASLEGLLPEKLISFLKNH